MSLENMKVIALGGCGGMGRYAVKTALEYDFVKEIQLGHFFKIHGKDTGGVIRQQGK